MIGVCSVDMLQLLLDLRPNEEHAKAWIVKAQTTMGVQAAPAMAEHEVRGLAVPHTGPQLKTKLATTLHSWDPPPPLNLSLFPAPLLPCASGQHHCRGADKQRHEPHGRRLAQGG